jgi:hypothetical protein
MVLFQARTLVFGVPEALIDQTVCSGLEQVHAQVGVGPGLVVLALAEGAADLVAFAGLAEQRDHLGRSPAPPPAGAATSGRGCGARWW